MKAYPKDSDGRFMDLRDYIAARAMQAILSRVDTELTFDAKVLAVNSYKVADSMIRAREIQDETLFKPSEKEKT